MKRRAFTMVELLVVISIICILAAIVWAALNSARQAGREAATKATIAKLHSIVMERYESYRTRRVQFDTTGMTSDQINAMDRALRADPKNAARYRLDAIRDTMRMEMPDAKSDIDNGPITFTCNGVPWKVTEPALHILYRANPPTTIHDPAQCLYLFVSMSCPEAMEQFSQAEIGMVAGHRVFVDGWGMPIKWIRWAPGYRSGIQSGDATTDHDPFDPMMLDAFAFKMIPLIYSASGKLKPDGNPQYGIEVGTGAFTGDPYANADLGKIISGEGGEGIITNHNMEQR